MFEKFSVFYDGCDHLRPRWLERGAEKNIRPLVGKPMIAWTVEQALATPEIDFVAVSSDCSAILAAALDAGASLAIERPAELATDTVSVHPAILHCLNAAEAALAVNLDHFVYLQTTSPLRSSEDISGALELWRQCKPGSVVSVTEATHSPYFSLVEMQADGRVVLCKPTDPPLTRRQDAPLVYQLNGAIYVFDRDRHKQTPRVLFPDTEIYEMPTERSFDIDTQFDWILVEFLMQRKLNLR